MGESGEPETLANRRLVANRTKVLLAGPSVRWAAQSARRAGYHVIGVDLFGDVDTLAACDAWKLLPQSEHVAERLQRWAAIENVKLRRVGGLDGNEINPTDLAGLARRTGFEVPETSAEPFVPGSTGTTRWLYKRIGGTGGLGVRFATPAMALQADCVWQRHITGRPHGVVCLVRNEGVTVLGVCRTLTTRIGDCPFVYAGSCGPVALDPTAYARVKKLAESVASETGIRGLVNFDFQVDRTGRWFFLEANLRPSGSCEVLELALTHSGQLRPTESLMGWHLDALAGDTDSAIPEPLERTPGHVYFTKRFVFATRNGTFCTERFEQLKKWVEHDDEASISFADIPHAGLAIEAGQPILTLLVSQRSTPPPQVFRLRSLARDIRNCSQELQNDSSSRT